MTVDKLLLVDDDATFSGVMARSFTKRGFAVQSCDSADSALLLCRDWQPTHILLDLNMPGSSGLTVLPELLKLSPQAKLVVLTGYSSIATAVEATKAGAHQYLCKPATTAEIVAAFADDVDLPVTVPQQPPSVERLEWEHIHRVLAEYTGNISATARALGMHRRTLQRKLKKRPVKR